MLIFFLLKKRKNQKSWSLWGSIFVKFREELQSNESIICVKWSELHSICKLFIEDFQELCGENCRFVIITAELFIGRREAFSNVIILTGVLQTCHFPFGRELSPGLQLLKSVLQHFYKSLGFGSSTPWANSVLLQAKEQLL